MAVVILSSYAITSDYRNAGLGHAVYVNKQDLRDPQTLLDALEDALHDARKDESPIGSVEHMITRIFGALGLSSDGSVNLRVMAARIYFEEAGPPSPST